MFQIRKIVNKKNIKIIEDCAQAHGAKINNKHVGNFGELGAFSFFPGKNLGGFGDGGCIITNNKEYYYASKRIRNHGALKKYDHTILGRNSRLDTIQSAVLALRLKKYNFALRKRNLIASVYDKELRSINQLKIPQKKNKNYNAYHQYVIKTDKKRNELQNFLKLKKIDTMIHYPYMLSELKIFQNSKGIKKLLKIQKSWKKNFKSPISEEHSLKEIYYITQQIKFFLKKNE